MPIRIIRDPNRPFNWYDSIPAKRDPTQLPKDPHDQYQVDPDFFDPDVLEVNEFRQGHNVIAKIPNIEGRITRKQSNGTTYIELIVARWYDKEKKQTRNRRVTIGVDVSGIYRGMMMANENYHEYFDTKGNLVKAIQLEGENGPEAPAPDQKTPETNTKANTTANQETNTTTNPKANIAENTQPNRKADTTTNTEPNKTATTTTNTKPDNPSNTGANKTESTTTNTETKKKTTNAATGKAATSKPKKTAPVKIPKQLLAEMVKMLDQKQQIERSKHPFLNTDTEESPQMSHDLNECIDTLIVYNALH